MCNRLLQMLVLDGNLYDQKFLGEAARGMNLRASNADLNACSLLLNNKVRGQHCGSWPAVMPRVLIVQYCWYCVSNACALGTTKHQAMLLIRAT